MLSFPAYGCRTGSGSISGSASRSLETRQEIRIPSHEGAVGPRWTGCREEKQKQTHRVEVTFRRVVRAAGGDRPLAGLQRQVPEGREVRRRCACRSFPHQLGGD